MLAYIRERVGRTFMWLLRFYVLWAIFRQIVLWFCRFLFHQDFSVLAEFFCNANAVLIDVGIIIGYIIVVLTPIWAYVLHYKLKQVFPESYTITIWSLSGILFIPFYGVFVLLWKLARHHTQSAYFVWHTSFTSELSGWRQFLSVLGSRLFLAWFAYWIGIVLGILSMNLTYINWFAWFLPIAIIGTVLVIVTSFMKDDPTRWRKSLPIWTSRLLWAWGAIWIAVVLGALSVNLYVFSLVVVGTVFLTMRSLWDADIFSYTTRYVDFFLPLIFLAVLAKVVETFEVATAKQLLHPPSREIARFGAKDRD